MWTEKYQDFYEAMEIARTLNETWWLEKGKNNLTNLRFQTPLYKFLTGNILTTLNSAGIELINLLSLFESP